jgi:hypothetical protein
MKNYLFFEIEANASEVIIKVDTTFGTEDNNQSGFVISNDNYVPTKGDKLYFLPGVNIPRVKMKDLTMEHGIKSVRNIDEATHIFAGRSTTHKITSNNWYYRMSTDHFKQMFETVKDKMDMHYVQNVETALEFYQEECVYMDYSSSSEIRNEYPFLEARKIEGLVASINNSRTFYAVDDNYRDYFPAVTTLTIYDEAELLKYINGPDAVIIDSVMFEQLSDMFNSSDNDNHILAMEIMANSNYIDSLLYLELLFKEHSGGMYHCHTKKHVNFKSLLGYLNKDSYMSTNIDDIMKSLIDKGVLDTEKINVIMDRYAYEIEDHGSTDFFKVKSVTVNEETLALLNTNYVYNKLEDFVPEGQVEEEVVELHANLEDLNSMPGEIEELEITDEDIESAFTNIVRDELKSELIELEEEKEFPEDESVFTEAEDYALGEIISNLAEESESNNNQKEQDATDDFEWF